MFPLGTVLLPGMVLPLHVFEPRYRQMVDDCRAGDGRFGVVLIERGSEVGGGDVRTDVGTVASILEAQRSPDGRWALAARGEHRIRVEQWLDDDPYPRAEVRAWPDDTGDSEGFTAHKTVVEPLLRRAAALVRELGHPAPDLDLELVDEPIVASYQAIAAAPLGPMDQQRLLSASTVGERWKQLEQLLGDQITLLQAQLAG